MGGSVTAGRSGRQSWVREGEDRYLAWLQATCPEAEYRDGVSAGKMATKACELTGWKIKACGSTLSAAHAENGEFANAVEIAERFGDPNLNLYRNSKPVRDE